MRRFGNEWRTAPTWVSIWLCLLLPVVLIAQDTQEPSSPPAEAPADPLSDLLKRVFGSGKADSNPVASAHPNGGESDDPLNRRFAGSSREARCLVQAQEAIASEDWQAAVQLLQWVLDQPQDTIVPLDGGVGRTLQAEAEARIGRLPAPGLQMYRDEFGRIAAQMLQQAHGPDALRGTAAVANRYFHTDAGKQATAKVASLLFDRGEYAAAATWYSRLTEDPAFQNAVDWRARATYALVQSGERKLAEPLLQSLAQHPARNLVSPAGPGDTLAAWILKQPAAPAPTPQLEDWLTLYGTPAHVGIAPDSEPLLLQRWSQPLTARYGLEQQARSLMQDLSDNQRAAIPAGIPIVVGDRVAFRTLRGLAVVDVPSGRLLWENDPELSAEGLLANDPQRDENPFSQFGGMAVQYADAHFDQHPLTNLLLRDAAYGLLSSDGRRVFSIENSVLMPPATFGYWWGANSPAGQDAYLRDWSSNQIHAYDLATGEQLWECGGRMMQEPFDPPLAGVFFFGPPVADGEELYAIGERDDEIHLFALAPETGEPLWSQTIGTVETGIDRDLVRRLWTCTPAVDGGLIICPTSTGWLVAVDRHTHRIEWAHQFSEKPVNSAPAGGGTMYTQQPLNERWSAAAPIVSNGSVFFAPPEQPDASGQDQPRLICLEARTGALRWARPKGLALYLAGVFSGRPLVVGRDDIKLLNPGDGLPAWTVPIPATAGPPSGRGIAVGGRFLLPLESGQLWAIDLADGRIDETLNLPGNSPEPPLGNLAVCRGMLLSLGPFGLTGFEQRTALQREIDARLAADPRDLWAAVKQAEVFAVSGDHAAALRALGPAEAAAADDPQLQERRRKLTFDSLVAVLQANPQASGTDFEHAARLAAGEDEKLELERLIVVREIAAGNWEAAFDRCQQIAAEFSLDRVIEDGPTAMRLDVWLGSRLSDVATLAPSDVAEVLGERIAAQLESSALAAPAAISLERLYGFHPAAQGFLWRLIEDSAYRKDFAGAEVRLRRFIEQGEQTTAAAALARLGDLLVEFGQPVDAAVVYARLADEFGDVVLPSLKTGAETARERFSSGSVARADLQPPPPSDWPTGEYRVSHYRVANSDYITPQLPLTRQLRAPFFQQHTFEFDTQSPVMTVSRRSDNGVYWRLPLRTTESQAYNQSAVVFGQGLQAIVLHRGIIHALSLPDRRVLWSRPVSDRGVGIYARHIYDGNTATLHAAGSFAARFSLAGNQSPTGMLALVTSRYVACHGRGEFLVLDPLTGDMLWRRRGITPQTALIGDARILCIVPDQSAIGGAYAVSAADGRARAVGELPAVLKNTVAVTASGFIRVERRSGGRGAASSPPRFQITAFDPLRQSSSWSQEFNPRSSLTFVDDALLFILDETSGTCSLLDLESGALRRLGNAPVPTVAQSSEKYALADARQVYLVLNDSRNNFNSYIHPPALRASGTIVAFARDGSGPAWQQTVENQNLLVPGFEQSPLLVFLAYDHVHLPDIEADYSNARLVVVDKRDGRVVAEDSRASPNGSYYRVDINPRERAIDIHAHNERLRIEAATPGEGAPDGP